MNYDEGTDDQNGKPSTSTQPFSLYSAYYYFHNLLLTLINALPPNDFQLKKVIKRTPTWAQMQTIAVQDNSHTDYANQLVGDYNY